MNFAKRAGVKTALRTGKTAMRYRTIARGFGFFITFCCLAADGGERLRPAIEDLRATFSDRYPNADHYLSRLDRIEQAAVVANGAVLQHLHQHPEALWREALAANPPVAG